MRCWWRSMESGCRCRQSADDEGLLFQGLFHALRSPRTFYLWSRPSVRVLIGKRHNCILFIKHFIDLYWNNTYWDFYSMKCKPKKIWICSEFYDILLLFLNIPLENGNDVQIKTPLCPLPLSLTPSSSTKSIAVNRFSVSVPRKCKHTLKCLPHKISTYLLNCLPLTSHLSIYPLIHLFSSYLSIYVSTYWLLVLFVTYLMMILSTAKL